MTRINLMEERNLVSASTFAKRVGVTRTYIYELIKQDKIDWTDIDGVIFVCLTDKTFNYETELYNKRKGEISEYKTLHD